MPSLRRRLVCWRVPAQLLPPGYRVVVVDSDVVPATLVPPISLDIMRRDLVIAPSTHIERICAMASIEFEEEVRSDKEHGDDVLLIRWVDTIS